jgi:hypothetical protein
MTNPTKFLLLAFGLVAFGAGRACAGPIVVTFYNDEAKFLAAIGSPTLVNFEGIVSDTGSKDFGPSLQVGSVTFTSPNQPFPNHVLVVGKNSQTLGAPFDSAILTPNTDPGGLSVWTRSLYNST